MLYRPNVSVHNLIPLKKCIPTTELVSFMSPTDKNVMESSPLANKYIFWHYRSGPIGFLKLKTLELTTTDFESNLFSFNTTLVLICDSKQIHTMLGF